MQRIVELQESWRIMVEFNTHGGAGQQYQEHKVCLEVCMPSKHSHFVTPLSESEGLVPAGNM